MSNNVNIILNTSNDRLTDKDGNLISSCNTDAALGDISGNPHGTTKIFHAYDVDPKTSQDYFTPMKEYKNPMTWKEIIFLIILKIIFIVVFAYSEDWGWWLVYVGALITFIIFVYLAATFDYSYSHLLKTANEYENPWYILWTLVANILFYIAMYLCGISLYENKKFIIILSEIVIWATLFLLIIADAYRFFLHRHLMIDVANAFGLGLRPKSAASSSACPQTKKEVIEKKEIIEEKDEVFNIAGNEYNYKEARAVCKAFGAKLANYEQIEKAYQEGAEWVNYGWSEGQYAYFPLQKDTWLEMDQNNPENANGKVRPGISGGYFANPELLLGANCFGKKPKKRQQDLKQILPGTPARSAADIELDKKVEFYKKNANIYSFNADRWYHDPKKKDN